MEETGSYICNFCKTQTVDFNWEWGREFFSGREASYCVYKCSNCYKEKSVHEDDYECEK